MTFLREVAFCNVNFKKPDLVMVRLNSAQAADWLRFNTSNRRIRRTLVEYLKKQIKHDEWQDNHPQPIVFSAKSLLLDGQHRLQAISESELENGQSVCIRVETGASEVVREYLDTGISRTLDDRVALFSDPRLNHFAAQIVASHWSICQSAAAGKPTPDDAKEYVLLHGESIQWAFERHKRERGTGQIIVALAATEYYERFSQLAEEFYVDLFIPAGRVQQAQMLRDFLTRILSISGRNARVEIYQKCISCMKAHADGREVKKVLRHAKW